MHYTCSEPSSSGFISSQEQNYIKKYLGGECDEAARLKSRTLSTFLSPVVVSLALVR